MVDRRELRRQYKETARPAGVFAVRNTAEDKLLLGVSPDIPGMLNRQRFQLEMGSHPDSELQADWARLGPDGFAFEALDELEASSDPNRDMAEELGVLGELWRQKVTDAGQRLYAFSKRLL